jgi:hypothetical protein
VVSKPIPQKTSRKWDVYVVKLEPSAWHRATFGLETEFNWVKPTQWLVDLVKTGKAKSVKLEAARMGYTQEQVLYQLKTRWGKKPIHIFITTSPSMIRIGWEVPALVKRFVRNGHHVTLVDGLSRADFYAHSFIDKEIERVINDEQHPWYGQYTKELFDSDTPCSISSWLREFFWKNVNTEMDAFEKFQRYVVYFYNAVVERNDRHHSVQSEKAITGLQTHAITPIPWEEANAYGTNQHCPGQYKLARQGVFNKNWAAATLPGSVEVTPSGHFRCPDCGRLTMGLSYEALRELGFSSNYCDYCDKDLGLPEFSEEILGDRVERVRQRSTRSRYQSPKHWCFYTGLVWFFLYRINQMLKSLK